MKTKEKLERAGWLYKDNYATLEIFGRKDERLLYNPRLDEVHLVYGTNTVPYKPMNSDIETLCEK